MAMDPIGTPRRTAPSAPQPAATAGLAVSAPSSDFQDRYDAVKQVDAERDKLFQELLAQNRELRVRLSDTTTFGSDHLLRRQLKELESRYVSHMARWDELTTRDPFVLVLLDCNDLVFDSDLLRLGADGGRVAVDNLASAVRRWAAVLLGTPLVHVCVRMYASTQSLAATLRAAGIVDSSLLESFISGLTQNDWLCDFVDVGPADSRVASKLNAQVKLHLNDVSCKQIFLGCSSDDGHAGYLEPLAGHEEHQHRVTLIEGTPLEATLASLSLRKQKIPRLFQSRRLSVVSQSNSRSNSNFNPSSGCFTPSSMTPMAGKATSSPLSLPSSMPPPPSSRSMSITSVENLDASTGAAPPGHSEGWANVAKKAVKLPYTDLTQPVLEPVTGPVVRLNKQGYRLDAKMDYDHDKVFVLKQIKLCNQHYIGRGCCHYNKGNSNCPHTHDRILSSEERKWLRVVSRETVCKRGVLCRDADCIYGHQCPYPKQTEGTGRGVLCVNGSHCRFLPEMHNMDTKVHREVAADRVE